MTIRELALFESDGWLRRLVAVVIPAGLALVLRSVLDPALGDAYPFIFAFAAVALAAAFGGWKAGVASTVLNYLLVDWFFLQPRFSLWFPEAKEALGATGSFALTTGVITWLAHRMRSAVRHERIASVSLHAERERLRVTLHSIGDGVIATDSEGRVTFLNPVAEEMTGWRYAEAREKHLTEVFHIINETTRAPVENPVERVLATGKIVGLANHTILISRDRSERAIADSAAPIRTLDGAIVGVVLVFRDVESERLAEHARARRATEQSMLTAGLERLLSLTDSDAFVHDLCRQVMVHVGADVYFYFRLGPNQDTLLLEGSAGVDDELLEGLKDIPLQGTICGVVAGARAPLLITQAEIDRDPHAEAIRRLGIRSYACAPLTARDQLLGTLSFGSRTRADFVDEDFAFIKTVAQHISLALDRLGREQALLLREQKLSEQARLLDLSNDAILVCDTEDRIRYFSRGAEQMYGWSAGEMIGQVKYDTLKTEYGALSRALVMAELIRRGYWEGELINTGKTGKRIVVMSRWVLDKDANGNPAFVLKSDTDITARKAAADELRRNQEQLRLVADHIPALVAYVGRDLVCRFANAAFADWYGVQSEEVVGRHVSEILGPELYAQRLPYVQSALLGEEVRFQAPSRHRRLGRRQTEIVYIPDRSVRSMRGFYAFVLDVTDKVNAQRALEEQAEELRDAARRKDEFLAMLAHELRNPLASASSAAALLDGAGEPETRQWASDVINRQVSHLSRLIDDLLDVSRITSGKIRLQKEHVDIVAVLRRAAEAILPLIREREHDLQLELPDGGRPLIAEVDPTRLEQIVVNLLSNAAKYTDRGGTIWLTAEKTESTEGKESVLVVVRDTGVGIPPEQITAMFELFTQGERSIARSEGGLGIGLTLVKRLTEMHGGEVRALSDGPGRGSEFQVCIPSGNGSGKVSPAPAVPVTDGIPKGSGASVLVVDDNHDTAAGLQRLLTRWGYRPFVAHEGPQAVTEALRLKPAFILLDIGLPGLDGYEVCRRLRAELTAPATKIIAVTGYGQEEDIQRSREAGFDRHLVKPVNLDELRLLLAER